MENQNDFAARIEELLAQLTASNNDVQVLTTGREEDAKKLEELAASLSDVSLKLVAAEEKNVELATEKEILLEVNAELVKKVEELSAPKSIDQSVEKSKAQDKPVLPSESFEVDGTKYKFISPVFVHKKQRITAEQALTDTDLLNELVTMKSGSIAEA